MSRQQRRARERAARKATSRGRALAASALLFAGSASAATFTASNLNDAGPGTLRQAVLDANATPGADTIAFQSGLSGTITLTSGEIAITEDLTINGPGSSVITVSGNNASRIFNIGISSDLHVALNNLTLQNGNALKGGAIFADRSPTLSLDRLVIRGSTAQNSGGGVYFGSFPPGSLSMTNSVISGNTAGLAGGGLYGRVLEGSNSRVQTYLKNDTFTGNQAGDSGGAIAVGDRFDTGFFGSVLSVFTMLNTVVTANTAGTRTGYIGRGGGVAVILGNAEYPVNGKSMVMADCVITGNVADPNDAASAPLAGTNSSDWGRGGGLYINIRGNTGTVQRTTISGNTASEGGGIFDNGLIAENVTIANNFAKSPIKADANGGGVHVGAFYPTHFNETTIAGNSAQSGGGGIDASHSPVELRNSIVANNAAAAGSTPDVNPDTSGYPPLIANYTLIKNPGTAIIAGGTGNITGQDPQLGPLQPNGSTVIAGAPGSTQTPLTERQAGTSPVVNAGDPAFAPPPATDERNMPRVSGGRIDMGAVELQASTIQFTAASVSVSESGGSITLSVSRTSGDGAASVNFATADGTAHAGTDYTPQSGTLSWADGDTANKTITIPILDDTTFELTETFNVALSAPSSGATIGANASEVVTIIDDDTTAVPTLSGWVQIGLAFALAAIGLRKLL